MKRGFIMRAAGAYRGGGHHRQPSGRRHRQPGQGYGQQPSSPPRRHNLGYVN